MCIQPTYDLHEEKKNLEKKKNLQFWDAKQQRALIPKTVAAITEIVNIENESIYADSKKNQGLERNIGVPVPIL